MGLPAGLHEQADTFRKKTFFGFARGSEFTLRVTKASSLTHFKHKSS